DRPRAPPPRCGAPPHRAAFATSAHARGRPLAPGRFVPMSVPPHLTDHAAARAACEERCRELAAVCLDATSFERGVPSASELAGLAIDIAYVAGTTARLHPRLPHAGIADARMTLPVSP